MKIEKLYKIYQSFPFIVTDTREIKKDCIFFSLKGEKFNGNKFAKDAIEKGAKYAVIDEKEYQISKNYILVVDVLDTLQQLANYHRKQFNIPIIGITGTNGKTTTKELINAVLSKSYKTSATTGNLNNHIGVPLTLLSIPNDCEIAIIEMGASHVGEIDFLCRIAEPNFGIITNIGTAHIEGFGSTEGVERTKNELYQFIKATKGTVFVNNDDEKLIKLSANIDKYTYGTSKSNCNAKLISSTPTVQFEWNKEIIISNLYGRYNFNNMMAAICIGNYFKIPSNKIKEAIESYQPTNNRSQLIKIDSNTIFLDAYNANPTSMNAAIDTFAENNSKNKLMLLGDMLELGTISQLEHQKIIDKVQTLKINALFVGKEFNAVPKKYSFTYLQNYNEAITWLKIAKLVDFQILIKGSRGMQLEKVVAYLLK
ncbi:MAG: UDP-N-acetylmuramoyl-tripeptide--D-alanyl-D-alanine ligase [Flavobacteriales bacterium CG_4_10_14_0_2_um_filter_32_8]|nr:MAG: UDP-N-acetylmuramoyl-tripeptide--D-alanyl-D-alanine ligase [Flavobacteriales bacterium CG_4_10_14_0_2_um_filter_32_8]PJB16194.1 MAG: UDP-N-acetylmuramoyl-tripeptide--D-alanyl-D-alanine ligase [Flavobacteriales bacterium CG_4_9_14_3_um_filter_32_8]